MVPASSDIVGAGGGGEETAVHPGDGYEMPAHEAAGSWTELKARIKQHYDIASTYYHSLWGEHIHHSYFKTPEDTKETGQTNLIELLLDISDLPRGTRVLDVGCGLGGTGRYLAKHRDCRVTGITISTSQVEMARKLSNAERHPEAPASSDASDSCGAVLLSAGGGSVAFRELDAETLGDRYPPESFDAVWISEALSHFPNKAAFFQHASLVLQPKGRLILADWFKAPGLTEAQSQADIRPIEDGMLLPPLCTTQEYVALAAAAGLKLRESDRCPEGVEDISREVAKTWLATTSLNRPLANRE